MQKRTPIPPAPWDPATHYGPCTADEGNCPDDGVFILSRTLGGVDTLSEVRFAAADRGAHYQRTGDLLGRPFPVVCERHAHEALDHLIRDAAVLRGRALDRAAKETTR